MTFRTYERRDRRARCGTPTGYAAHQSRGEKPCDACTAAKARYDESYRAAPERRRKARLYAKAQQLALRDLKNRHLEEYHALYAHHRTALANMEETSDA